VGFCVEAALVGCTMPYKDNRISRIFFPQSGHKHAGLSHQITLDQTLREDVMAQKHSTKLNLET
jgi:hypothetical protein